MMTIEAFPYESYAAGSYQAASAYLAKTNAPQTALDWQSALRDPYSKIGQLYLALLSQSQLEQEDWLDFQHYLAHVQWATNQQVINNSARQADARYEREREQILQASLERQQQTATVSDQPFLTTGLAEALDRLILGLIQLMNMRRLLIKQNVTLDNQWRTLNTHWVNDWMHHLMARRNLFAVADRHILMQKTHQLTKALTTPSLTQLLTVNPRMTDLLHQAVKQPHTSSIFENIVKINDAMSELNLHAQWTDQAEPLMGGALLVAIKARRAALQPTLFAESYRKERMRLVQQAAIALNQTAETEQHIHQAKQNIYTIQTQLQLARTPPMARSNPFTFFAVNRRRRSEDGAMPHHMLSRR